MVIAAKLIQIKSEALLPRPPLREQEEEDPGIALARQLIIYKRFKEISNLLAERQDNHLRTYPRLAPAQKVNKVPNFGVLNIDELISATISAFSRIDLESELGTIVSAPRIPIREKIEVISKYLRIHNQGKFRNLLPNKPLRLEIVVTFLALLELVKRRLLYAKQEQLFGEINIEIRNVDWDEIEEIELEFGE
jgi:segregation and condensation protein A